MSDRLTEIADEIEAEMYERDITSGAGYWTLQAIVRLRLAAVWANWAASPGRHDSQPPPMSIAETQRMMAWIHPLDAGRLKERIRELQLEDAATCAGQDLLEDLLGEVR